MKIRLYVDEDAQDLRLIQALRLRGVTVASSTEAAKNSLTDEEQLAWAAREGYVLFTFNTRDYYQLHTHYLQQGNAHSGIIAARQQEYSIGEQLRRLLKLIALKSAEEMINQFEFLSAWE